MTTTSRAIEYVRLPLRCWLVGEDQVDVTVIGLRSRLDIGVVLVTDGGHRHRCPFGEGTRLPGRWPSRVDCLGRDRNESRRSRLAGVSTSASDLRSWSVPPVRPVGSHRLSPGPWIGRIGCRNVWLTPQESSPSFGEHPCRSSGK